VCDLFLVIAKFSKDTRHTYDEIRIIITMSIRRVVAIMTDIHC